MLLTYEQPVCDILAVLPRLLGSATRASIVRLLFGSPSTELHIRELQRRTGMALRSVIVQVNLLTKLGLLLNPDA